MKAMNLALRFVLELALLFFLGYWGFQTGQGYLTRVGLGLGTPFTAAVIWGLFLSPKASINIPVTGRLAVEIILFGSAVATLFYLGFVILPTIFGIVYILNRYFISR